MSNLKDALIKAVPAAAAMVTVSRRLPDVYTREHPMPMHRQMVPGTELTIRAYPLQDGVLADAIMVQKGQQAPFWIGVSAKMHKRLTNLLAQARALNAQEDRIAAGLKIDVHTVFLKARFVCIKVKGELTWVLREPVQH